jgi:hypothetical protein
MKRVGLTWSSWWAIVLTPINILIPFYYIQIFVYLLTLDTYRTMLLYILDPF